MKLRNLFIISSLIVAATILLDRHSHPALAQPAQPVGLRPSNNLSDLTNVSTARTNLGLAIGTNVQAFDADLTTWAGLTPSAFFQTLVDDSSADTARSTLSAGAQGAIVKFTGTTGAQVPYSTLALAKAGASSGDTVIVGPGSYTVTTGTTLAKNGVNWHFLPGAIVSMTGNGTKAIFDDLAEVVVCRITGCGQFVFTAGAEGEVEYDNVLLTTRATTQIEFEFSKITVTDAASAQFASSAIRQNGGTVYCRGNEIVAQGNGIWWASGNGYYNVNQITAGEGYGYAIYCTPDGPVWNLANTWESGTECWVNFQKITGTHNAYGASGTTNARVWLEGMEMVSSSNPPMIVDGCWTYVTLQKLQALSGANGAILCGGTSNAILTGTIQKLSCGVSYGINITQGTVDLTVQHIEDILTAETLIETSGTVDIQLGKAIGGTAAVGVHIGGGTAHIHGGRIDTSACNGPTVDLDGNGLTMSDINLIAHGSATDTITAGQAQTMHSNTVRDVSNRGKHANVTIVNDPTF